MEGRDFKNDTDAEVIARLRQVYDFLPKETNISVKDGIVRIDIPESAIANKQEAVHLLDKGSERAKQGEYQKAVGIYSRVLELDPSNVEARRNLGMAFMELGELEKAREHLIEAATLDPNDAWSYVVLGNILARDENKWDAAEHFYRKALALKPDDGWALNSIGAIYTERKKYDEAVEWFDKAIAANPKFANPYYGRAHAFVGQGKPEAAMASIEELFRRAELQDTRSRPVFHAARESYEATAKSLATIYAERARRSLEMYQEHVEDLSGFPVKIERGTLAAMIAGQSQMAWKKQRDHHLIVIRSQYPEPLSEHIKAHELTHIALEAEARAVGRNRWFSTSAGTRETAIRSMSADFKKFERARMNNNKVAEVMVELISGTCGFLFNAPLDMLIERRIKERLPDLRYAQYCSLLQLAREKAFEHILDKPVAARSVG